MSRKQNIDWLGCGIRLRAERKRLGLSREAFSEEVGISAKNWGKIETGKQATSLNTLYKASLLLNVSMDYLLTGKEKEMDSETSAKVFESKSQIAHLLDHCSDDQLKYIVRIIQASLQMYNFSQPNISQDESK